MSKPINNYKIALINRARAERNAQPMRPDKALDYLQQKNRDNLRAWRRKLEESDRDE